MYGSVTMSTLRETVFLLCREESTEDQDCNLASLDFKFCYL